MTDTKPIASPKAITAAWLSSFVGEVQDVSCEEIGVGVWFFGRLFRLRLHESGVPPSVVLELPTLDQTARERGRSAPHALAAATFGWTTSSLLRNPIIRR